MKSDVPIIATGTAERNRSRWRPQIDVLAGVHLLAVSMLIADLPETRNPSAFDPFGCMPEPLVIVRS